MDNYTTIRKLFGEQGISFSIPSYQRAYSWEVDSDKKQVAQFLSDILEQIKYSTSAEGGISIEEKPYYLGHLLFEENENDSDNKLIIDGQQRLTTVVILLSVLRLEFENRRIETIGLDKKSFRLQEFVDTYLIKYGEPKLNTVEYDNNDFRQLIYYNRAVTPQTTSMKRVWGAFEFFKKQLRNVSDDDICKIKECIDNTVVTTHVVHDKIQATQIFAFQNDRGKALSNLEIIKAYLMHCIYRFSKTASSAEKSIKQIESIFSEIYRIIEKINTDEDTVLNYHCSAFIALYETSVESVKKKIEKEKELSGANVVDYIIRFCNELRGSFIAMQEFENRLNYCSFIADCMVLESASCLPLFLKVYSFSRSVDQVENIAKTVERILFKKIFSEANYRTNNLPRIALEYTGDYSELEKNLQDIDENGFLWYWEFKENCKRFFEVRSWHYIPDIKYVLWKYENYIRDINRQPPITPNEYLNNYGHQKRLENTTDHITPQQPDFTTYTSDFIEEYLNCIGNLALITWSTNSQKRNKNPYDEKEIFGKSSYLSNREIFETLEANKKWGEEEIKERKTRINRFVFSNWKLD